MFMLLANKNADINEYMYFFIRCLWFKNAIYSLISPLVSAHPHLPLFVA